LKWNALRLDKVKNDVYFQKGIKIRRKEFKTKWENTILEVQPFKSFYTAYFYLKDTSVFDGPYEWNNRFPISLKSNKNPNPLFPIYFGLVNLNSETTFDVDLHTSIDEYLDIISIKSEVGRKLEYGFDYDLFELKSPWCSGLTQSLAASYYLRMYLQSKDKSCLEKAESYFSWCMVSFEKGGVLSSTSAGLEWVQEYPSENASYVLNGHMFAIIGVIELYQVTEKTFYKHTAEQWIRSLIHHLPEYQYKQYLLHNKLQGKLSNIEYQGLYVGLFKHLYESTKHPLFLEFYQFYNGEMDWKRFNRFYGI